MLKTSVLRLLKDKSDFISGQEFADLAGVTRNAVWKAVSVLKENGYEIEAVTNRGYRLLSCPDVMTLEEVETCMSCRDRLGELICLKSTDSTNDELKRRFKAEVNSFKDRSIAIAELQTAGKGRRGRSWLAKEGENIAMSILLTPNLRPNEASMLTILAALAVREAIDEIFPGLSHIKWPNDLLIEGKKVCGILTEMSAEPDYIEYVIVGIGINVNGQDIPRELEGSATSLRLESEDKRCIHRADLINLVLENFLDKYDRFLETKNLREVTKEYNSCLAGLGEIVRVLDPSGEYEGICEGLDSSGNLIVRRLDGSREKVYAGEVSLRGSWTQQK